jgi:hypothetical protein
MKSRFSASSGKPSFIRPPSLQSRFYKFAGSISLLSLLTISIPPLIEIHNQTKLENKRLKADAMNEVRGKVAVIMTDFYRGDIKGREALRNLRKLRRLYPMNDQLQVISTTEKMINEELQTNVAKPTSDVDFEPLPLATPANQPRESKTLRQHQLPIITRNRGDLPEHIPIDSTTSKNSLIQPTGAERRISPNDTDKSSSSGMLHEHSGYTGSARNDQQIIDEPGDIR